MTGDDVAALDDLAVSVADSPGSWLNLSFEELDDPNVVPDSALFGFLAARGPANPLATIMRESPDSAVSIGIQHRAGTKAAQLLREAGLPVPDGGRVRQDHPRRGLVVEWPQTGPSIATWLLGAMRELNRSLTNDTVHWEWTLPS